MGILVFLLTISSLILSSQSKTNWEETQLLKQLKNTLATSDSLPLGSCIASWDFTLDPCDSLFTSAFTCGFRCDFTDPSSGQSHVTEIALDQAGYSTSSLSSLTWNLPQLETLDLSNNFFKGQLPSSFSNLTRLRRLILSGNQFSGEIPSSFGSLSNLEELLLDNNNLHGSIPQTFNNLQTLIRLELQANSISGELPALSSLTSLYYLDVSNNAIVGPIPASLPNSLIQVSMRNNSLIGAIPSSIQTLASLQVLDLSHNQLSDTLPSSLFTHPSLQQLTLSFNSFTSLEPTTRAAAGISQLIAVDVSNNKLRGFLPFFLALMPKLAALNLENNELTGIIPTLYALKVAVPVAGVSPFLRLLLGGNYLFGPLPAPLVGMKRGSEVNVGLGNNCLYRCPRVFFFCQGGDQKSSEECRSFVPVIP